MTGTNEKKEPYFFTTYFTFHHFLFLFWFSKILLVCFSSSICIIIILHMIFVLLLSLWSTPSSKFKDLNFGLNHLEMCICGLANNCHYRTHPNIISSRVLVITYNRSCITKLYSIYMIHIRIKRHICEPI